MHGKVIDGVLVKGHTLGDLSPSLQSIADRSSPNRSGSPDTSVPNTDVASSRTTSGDVPDGALSDPSTPVVSNVSSQ